MSNIKSLKKLAQEYSLLYVEDDDDLRKSTVEIFDGLFKYTDTAVDGEDGLAVYCEYSTLNKQYFDIIVTDIQMPKMNGIELIKEILAINKEQTILVISAYDDKRYLVDLINMGVSGFIQKPLNSKQIITTLYNVCLELAQKNDSVRYIQLRDNCVWDSKYKILFKDDIEIKLTDSETKVFELLTVSVNRKFTSIEIFEYIYYGEDREYSADVIKSMFKRLRKKIPTELIVNTPQLGYNLQL